jgi:hypothetical protein
MGVLPAHDYERIRSAIRDAARAAWRDLRAARPDETFYYFGLATTPQSHRPAPTAASREGLDRTIAGYREQLVELLHDEVRWSDLESPYAFSGDAHFRTVERLFDALGEPFDRAEDLNRTLREAMVEALQDLDAEGFFGEGAARDGVVVDVTVRDGASTVAALASAGRLNPAAALHGYGRPAG